MIETTAIYEQYMMNAAFGQMKHLRDAWNYSTDNSSILNRIELCEIAGADYSEYEFIINQTQAVTRRAIEHTVEALMKAYNKEIIPVGLTWEAIRLISLESKEALGTCHMPEKGALYAFISEGVLYIFRESGIAHFLSKEVLGKLKKEYQFKDYAYILLIEGDAFSEVLNHNNDENDPSRGTHSYSLKFFFDRMFDADEYHRFREYYNRFVQATKNYFGLVIIKTLRPHSIYTFKKTVRQHIIEFDYVRHEPDFSKNHTLSPKQRKIINRQFLDEQYYQALTSNCEFAKCFMTAEWLYDSFNQAAGEIDLTAISMGYFKALEQFLYEFLGYHTDESREISLGKDEEWEDFSSILYQNKKKRITLGTMAKFLKNRDNLNMLRQDIDRDTIEYLRDVLTQISDQRNGYFHKDNIDDWGKVETDRNLTFIVFYLLLGAYQYRQEEQEGLGIEKAHTMDDYEKLCQYIHQLSFKSGTLEIPIIYINEYKGENSEYAFFLPMHDKHIEYNKYGEPLYSGVYCRTLNHQIHTFDRKTMPEEITVVQEGKLVTSRDIPITIEPSGPQKDIFRNGKFLAIE